ncbi:hypothetical protein C6P40_001857 [Pichia californica]|uniref:ubiquitinyl hydrolase 1 n=1 Tax=Pichia californica TaxID=460514 RepID=A0A9P6WIK0_9ASCO|nr:hypothetical protein C6P42_001836 [[Candida] californica]KAG0687795.1 hypothetical protein C6P40_001857 [[Candida] californica]
MDKSIDSLESAPIQDIKEVEKSHLDNAIDYVEETKTTDPVDSSGDSSPSNDSLSDQDKEDQNETRKESISINYEANYEKYLDPPPEGFDYINGYNTFEIDDLSKMLVEKERFKGPTFQVGNYLFNLILVCQKRQNFFFSVYLEGHPIGEENLDNNTENDDDDNDNDEDGKDDDNDEHSTKKKVWSFPAQFAFDAWDPENPNMHKNNNTRFRYNQRVTDWGFVQFLDTKSNLDSHFFKKNKVNITVYIRLIDDYTNVLYSDFRDYNSKTFTGYVGIENQGATCYLNSLLQSYFFTKSFRKKVYQIPTEDEISFNYDTYEEYKRQPKTVSLALQRIFYKLQTSNVAINSLELTHSFGWTTADAFTQHDVQELNRILMDRLETKMKGTEIDGCLNNIFVGKMNSFIRCINVDYESSRTEDFWDIQLNVKGLKNIQESFENYVELEILDGDNKYDASGFGLQDAEKGVIFESIPDVLHVQLKRYEYDFETDNMVKIHDRYEFFDEIDLKPYINKSAEHYDEDWNYKLHGVLVHQGDVSVGHYYAMIKPTNEDKWFKFDDDRVSRVTPYTVFEEGFGCGPPTDSTKQMTRDEYQNYIIRHHTSAYMLVYIRESKIPDVLAEVEESDVPPHISKQIEYEAVEDMRIKKEREEMHLYVNFKIYTDSTFEKYQGFDLGPNSDDRHYFANGLYDEDSFPVELRLLKTDSWSEFYETLAEQLMFDKTHIGKLRLWNIVKRTNHTFRPDRPIDSLVESLEEATVGDIATILENGVSRRKYSGIDRPIILSLYLEDACKDIKYLANHMSLIGKPLCDKNFGNYQTGFQALTDLSVKANDALLEPIFGTPNILIFLKYFSYEDQSLRGLSHLVIPHGATVEFIYKFLQVLFKFDGDDSLMFFEELDFKKRLEIKADRTFYKSEIGNGDIVCFGLKKPVITNDLKFRNLEEFYIFMESRIHFQITQLKRVGEDEEDYIFIETNDKTHNYDQVIDVWLSYYSSYQDITAVIGEKIGVSSEYIKLSFILNGHKNDLRSDYDFTEALSKTSKQYTISLYYEILKIPLLEFEGMELCHIYWVGNGICKEERHDFYLPKSSTVEQLLTKLETKIDIDPAHIDSLFGWIPDHNHKIKKCILLNDTIDNNSFLVIGVFPQYKEVYTSKNGSRDVTLVSGFQCYSAIENTHGLPFVFDIVKGELLPETLLRLRKLMGLSEKEFKAARIGITNNHSTIEYLDPVANSNIELYSIFLKNNFIIVVDHPDRKSRRASQHSSIMIKS